MYKLNEGQKNEDKYLIPLVLALCIGLWVFTGTLEHVIIDIYERIGAGFSMLLTALGILLLSAGTGIGIIYWVRRRARWKERN